MPSHPHGAGWLSAPVLLLVSILAACSESKSAAPSAASSPAITRESGGALSGASAGAGSAATAMPARTASAEPVSSITIIGSDNIFAPAEFRVRAGEEFAVTLENRGLALHDWRVRGVVDVDGRDAGTRLLSPGQSQTVMVTIERPGEYAFYCEVHPVEMRGKLFVQ